MYEIIFQPAASRDFGKLVPSLQSELKTKQFPILQQNPRSGKPLHGMFKGLWKYPFSFKGISYRIVYIIDEGRIVVTLIMIGSRESIYKRLKSRLR